MEYAIKFSQYSTLRSTITRALDWLLKAKSKRVFTYLTVTLFYSGERKVMINLET